MASLHFQILSIDCMRLFIRVCVILSCMLWGTAQAVTQAQINTSASKVKQLKQDISNTESTISNLGGAASMPPHPSPEFATPIWRGRCQNCRAA